MASLKIKYRHSSIEGKAETLFYQVIHNRVARQINSGYKIYPDEWDIFNSQIIIPAKTGENRHRYLVSLKKCIKEDISRLKDIMIRFENLGYKYTADEIIEYYSAPPVNEYFVSFCENLIEQLRQIGKMRTTETYTTTLNNFKRFMHSQKRDRDILFDKVDSNLMMEYEQYLKSHDICPNRTSYYMRNLRTMYNRAVEKELVTENQHGTMSMHPTKYISEADIYRLVMRSELPEAEKFKDWVCEEVLPSIRRHGAYLTDAALQHVVNEPDFLIGLANAIKKERKSRLEAEAKYEEQKLLIGRQQERIEELGKRTTYVELVLQCKGSTSPRLPRTTVFRGAR